MRLVNCILIVQLSCLCQALQNSTSQTTASNATVKAEEQESNRCGVTCFLLNFAGAKSNSDPYIHKLSGNCSFTLRLPGNRSSDEVALAANSTDVLLEQICKDLNCGSVYQVAKTSSARGDTCFHDCLYRDGRLQNCSESKESTCTVINGAVCGHQAVRLAGGSDRCAGRVELWKDGKWGTVCDDEWGLRDGNVVCAQLGCGYALSVTGQGGSFPQGRGPIHLDDLNCTGQEGNLWACPAAQDEPDCGHKEDAGVVCSEMRAIRLTGGLDRCSGKVEIHRNGSWGTVCDNCWNKGMASRVCSMLQCGAEPEQISQFLPPLVHNNASLYYYQCDSNVESLWQCKELVNKSHLCASSKASGVVCNGSLGFQAATTASAANVTLITGTTGGATFDSSNHFSLPSMELLGAITVSLLLLVLLTTNTMLCCHYRRKHAFLLQQTRTGPKPSSEHRHNSFQENVNLIKITSNPSQTDVPSNPRYLWTQLSSDSTSVDTDYEQYEPSNDPSVPLSTFRNSQRYKTNMKPSGLDSLHEEGIEPQNRVIEGLPCYAAGPTDPQYARVSKISMDSFDTSSTSSGECYENTNGYTMVDPEAGPSQSSAADGAAENFEVYNNQLFSGKSLHGSGNDEDDDAIYSPVSPDEFPSSDDDYDDVGT